VFMTTKFLYVAKFTTLTPLSLLGVLRWENQNTLRVLHDFSNLCDNRFLDQGTLFFLNVVCIDHYNSFAY
jgi:hypothetical protein